MNKKNHIETRGGGFTCRIFFAHKNITKKLESTHELAQRLTSGQWLQDLKAKAVSYRASLEAAFNNLNHQPPPLQQEQQQTKPPPITQDL